MPRCADQVQIPRCRIVLRDRCPVRGPGVPGDQGQLALQYWFFYYFNDYNDKHDADWEGIQLVFGVDTVEDALKTAPESVAYAQHEGGERADWDSDKVQTVGTRPIVYSSRWIARELLLGGPVARYERDSRLRLRRHPRGPSHREPLGAVVLPERVSKPSPTWLNFKGRWGQKLPGANNGPTGPNMKPRWDTPSSSGG